MNRLIAVVLSLILGGMGLVYVGCGRGPAYGKLQIMYSGNIRGNISPCG
jgi:hypothetical protein